MKFWQNSPMWGLVKIFQRLSSCHMRQTDRNNEANRRIFWAVLQVHLKLPVITGNRRTVSQTRTAHYFLSTVTSDFRIFTDVHCLKQLLIPMSEREICDFLEKYKPCRKSVIIAGILTSSAIAWLTMENYKLKFEYCKEFMLPWSQIF